MWMRLLVHIIACPLSTHQRVPVSRHIMAADAPDKRMQTCPEGLSASPKRAVVHHIRMGVRYTCRIWSGPCWFCAHRVLRYRPHPGPHCSQTTHRKLAHARTLQVSGHCSTTCIVACACGWRGEPALCMYCMRQSAWPKPGPRHAARLTRATGSWGASGPVFHVCLRYIHVVTPPKRRGRPANALRFTNQLSDHGDHGCQGACARRPRQAARAFTL
jgi:hypothetical protein